MEDVEQRATERPKWRRIVDFPLVTMVLAIAITLLSAGLATGLLEVAFRISGNEAPKWLASLVGVVAMLLSYKLFVRKMGETRHDDLRGPRSVHQLGAGIAAGVLLFSVIVLIAAILGVYRIVAAGDWSAFGPSLVNQGLFPAVGEELLFRAILFRWLEQFSGSWSALLISSALFGASHLWNPNASWIAAAGIAVEAGLMLGAAYMLTRRLWVPMGIHGAWNVTQGEIYDIPVSGTPQHGIVDARLEGSPLLPVNGFGLEASLIAIVVATAFGCWLLWLAVKRGELVQPWWVRRRASV